MRENVNTLHNIRNMSLLIYYLVNWCYKCSSLQLKSFKVLYRTAFMPDCVNVNLGRFLCVVKIRYKCIWFYFERRRVDVATNDYSMLWGHTCHLWYVSVASCELCTIKLAQRPGFHRLPSNILQRSSKGLPGCILQYNTARAQDTHLINLSRFRHPPNHYPCISSWYFPLGRPGSVWHQAATSANT